MSWDKGPDLVSPTSGCGVDVRATYTTSDDFHIDVIVAKRLRLKLDLNEQGSKILDLAQSPTYLEPLWTVPFIRRWNGKSFKRLGVHFGKMVAWLEIGVVLTHYTLMAVNGCRSYYMPSVGLRLSLSG